MNASVEQLVERARQNDAGAFAALVGEYERIARSVAFGVLGDAAAANDVTQDGFIRAWDRLDNLRESSRFGTWLCGIVRNLAVDHLRRRKRTLALHHAERAADPERWTHDPLDEICRRESSALVAGAVADLDDIARRAVTMRYYDELPSKQIAHELGISADAVDMRLIRARKRLRAMLPALATA